MPSSVKILFLALLSAIAAPASNTQLTTDKPIINFRLPIFNEEGYRAWLVRGSEARQVSGNQIAIKQLVLSSFNGKADEKVDTLLLSPEAFVSLSKGSGTESVVVTGPSVIRVVSDQFEASGTDWAYAGRDKRVSIAKSVRVVFKAELDDILK